jgi:hypothetical protein
MKTFMAKLGSLVPKGFRPWMLGVLGSIVLSVLGAVTYEVIKYRIERAGQREIVVVGIDEDNIWEDIREGVEEYKEQHGSTLKDLNIKVRLINHGGDLVEAQEKAQQLMANGRVVAVVLGGTSSQVERLVEHFRGKKPVLLVQATNPHLNLSGNTFRLLPNDKKQVEALTDFARLRWYQLTQTDTKIAIFRDETNTNYAGYLGDEVREMLDRLIASSEAPPGRGVRVVADGWIGGHNAGIYISLEFVNQIRPDLIFYAGNGRSLLPLIQQAAGFPNWPLPTLVLTNGSVDSEFLTLAEGRFHEAYATFPVCPEEECLKPKGPSSWEDEPSYKPFGYDSLALLLDAIRKTDPDKELTENTKVPSASRLVEALARIDYEGIAGNYGFNKNGENTEARFHVYRAVPDNSPRAWRWEHSPSDCPVVMP